MTLLVVSLYLPHTIHFNVDDPALVDNVVSSPILSRTTSSFDQRPAPHPHPKATPLPSPSPVPNFIQSLASRVTSANNTPPASPPTSENVKDFFYKNVQPSQPTSLSSALPLHHDDDSLPAGPTAALEFEKNFRNIYALSVEKKRREAVSKAAAATSSGSAAAGSASASSSSSLTATLRSAAAPTVTHPKSRANSPPPAKRIVDSRAPTVPNTPSLKIAPRRPAPLAPLSPKDPAAVFSSAPWSIVKYHKGNGGLRNAIARAEAEGSITDKKWIGTLGMPTDAIDENMRKSFEAVLMEKNQEAPVFVSDSTMEGHYTHYCKDILWPTFHYQIPDNAKSKAYEDHSWVHYHALNKAFADVVIQNYKPGDTIWVHDYHLLLVPGLIREKIPDAKIGFFLHIAFPSSEVYRCLPTRKLLLRGMLGADVVGFQSNEYARHFRQTCQVVLGLLANRDGSIDCDGRRVSVTDVAIGIDPPSLKALGEDPEVKRWRRMLRERWPDKKMIVGRDKLDQFRGVRHKLLGYERFLQNHPEYKEKAIFIQVCLTNIASQDLESEVSDIVTRINSSTHVVSEPPVVFLHQDISFEQYLALLYEADIFVVTSLREGMNLTCHEYIYCQSETSKGPLILSEFTGSAAVFGNNCLLVNPWDSVEVADAFEKALTMPKEERERRYKALYAEVTTNTCAHWVRLFLNKLNKAWEVNHGEEKE